MTKHKSHPNATLYCQLMEYIKWRIKAVMKTTEQVKLRQHYLDNRLAAEFCLLQLRFCCELLAIGCVAIHTDVPQGKKLRKNWNAERTMSAFSELKPEFFPKPIKDILCDDGTFEQQPVENALTREEFLSDYSFFASQLHTGNYLRYKKMEIKRFDFGLIESFVSKFIRLLDNHTYYLHDEEIMIRVIMNNAKDGKVWLNELQKVQPE